MNVKRTLHPIIVLAITIGSTGLLIAALTPSPSHTPSSPLTGNPNPPASPVKLIFIHHSTGENWLADDHGGLGIALRDNNYFVSDTNYGWGPDSIGDTTDIGHWWTWFRGPRSAVYTAALYAESGQHSSYSRLPTDPGGENEIIMFKSCFPNSHLGGNPDDPPTTGDNPLRGQDAWSEHMTVANAKGIYNDILAYFATRQDKLFVVITAPPLLEDDMYQPTDAEHAANARAFNNWLVNNWLDGYPHSNVAVFDFYNVLTSNGGDVHTNDLGWETGNHHRWWNGAVQHIQTVANNFAAYGSDPGDSHPTAAGGQKASGEFVQLLNVFYHRWKGAEGTPTPTATGAPSTATPTATPTATGTRPPSTATPTPTGTPPAGQYTMTFQDGVWPDASYAGTTDVILANDGEPNANLGGLGHLETFFGEGEEHRRSLMRWDLSALPGNATISGATVELYRYDGNPENAMQIALYRVIRDWTEGTGNDLWPDPSYVPDGATWSTSDGSTPWTTPGGDYDATIVDQITLPTGMGNRWVRLDATVAVRAWIEEGVPNYGLLLRPQSGDYTYHYYYSRNHNVSSLRPRLVVTYTVGGTATPTPTETLPPLYRIYQPLILKHWSAPTPTPTPTATTPPSPGELIQPSDLTYLGAFRLPDVPGPDEYSWKWSNWASALAYYPDGDPDGPNDGYPGSLFGTGHDQTQYVSEINIPVPIVSPGKNVNDLNMAETLQDFHDIRRGLFGYMEMPRVGLAYLPPQGEQTTGKLYFAWAPHLDEGATNPSHGWCELNLSNPRPAGAWRIGDYWNYVTGDYLFDIPRSWADTYVSGRYLATGRFRDGGQGAQGPSLFAIAPWSAGNPPPPGSTLPATPLLLYTAVTDGEQHTLNNYHHSDEWTGGAWLTAGNKSAVVFVGTKGVGDCWYGCADGTDEPPWPPDCDRGWWSTGFVGQMLFYDPADLAAVARGEMETWEPQPYATLDIDEYLYHIESTQQKYHLGAAGFDRERGLLYVFEPLADGDKPLVHVWRAALALLAVATVYAGPSAQEGQPQGDVGIRAAMDTGFTYQGRLTDGDSLANGDYDFEFKLYDAASNGTQVGSTVTKEDVTVTDGLFTVQLDFGAEVFTGDARWLEIGVGP